MENSIRDYASDGANISYNQIKTRFGDPIQIAATYVSEMESEELLNAVNARRVILQMALIAAVFAVVLWAVFVTASYVSFEKDMNGYTTVEVIEVTRRTTDQGGK